MRIDLKENTHAFIQPYDNVDFSDIQHLNKEAGWTALANNLNTKEAWENSNVAYVVKNRDEKLIGYIRGLTDRYVSLFICEMLIHKRYRGLGIGKQLLQYVHDKYPTTRIEMLATSTSRSFYENLGYRAFYGFRKS
ncbi:MAG TPA: GNAT family N-acetyltransferase [Bacillota bacterium]|nr:GNAT family N-acetyltransferase [Bacillota bacterium]